MDLKTALTNNQLYTNLQKIMRERVILMDGGMGTCLQAANLTIDDFGGADLEGCNENLNLTRPDVIFDIHKQYFEAGADVVETNTFGATPLVLAEYDLQNSAREINIKAAQLARDAAGLSKNPNSLGLVAGSMGPTTKAYSVTGGVTLEELIKSYRIQALGLIEGGVDFLLLETAQDTLNLRCGIEGIYQAIKELAHPIPLVVSMTIEPTGTMLAGQSAEALCTSLAHMNLLALGMNCSTGPEFMTSHVRALSDLSPFPVFCMPNAGLPNEDGQYDESPEDMGITLSQFANNGWLNIFGGCCGTSPEYINHFNEIRAGFSPRLISPRKGSFVSGIEFLEIEDSNRPQLVGERTNIIGSRKFKKLIIEDQFEEAAEIGRKQVKGGGQILDVCLANPDREEIEDMASFLPELVKKVRVPIMIDSTDDEVFELAMRLLPGKSILNSINLEEGEKRFERVGALAKRHGAAIVVGCIDEDPEQGMAVSRERKLEIACRSYQLLTEKYSIPPEDIIFDPLVFPCGTGDEQYVHSAAETIAGIELIKQKLPRTKTILGISNVSFGLPTSGREALNSAFLYHCTKAGLDMAIVNTQRIERYSSLPEEERALCEGLIFKNSQAAVERFSAYYREVKPKKTRDELANLPVEERLKICLVEGTKEGLIEALDEALTKYSPLEVINEPLMRGMEEVGRLFNANELIVAEVLQSAGVMKAAVAHLEPLMDKTQDSGKGKFLLATVKGDVHDIGKNLVEIILGNNGFEIINLGIKVVPEALIQAYREHKPDFIGLSGLLVKSAQEMVFTAEDLKNAGIDVPLLVGGAALSRSFTDKRIAPMYNGPVLYAVDAMTGLDFVNALSDSQRREGFLEKYHLDGEKVLAASAKKSDLKKAAKKRYVCDHKQIREQPTSFAREIFQIADVKTLFGYLNEQFFYTQHMGFKGSIRLSLEKGHERAVKLHGQIEALKTEILENHWFDCRGVLQFFSAYSEGDTLVLLDQGGNPLKKIPFPRQASGEMLCAADFVGDRDKRVLDCVGVFAVTTGSKVREVAQRLKDSGDYLKSHGVQALAVETAEAFAEYIHHQMRQKLGIEENLTLKEMVQTKYQGIRLSFGYPACPDLNGQRDLFELIKPEEAGIQLTESMMMDPEGSVSALVFSHPQAKYFGV